MKGQVYVSAASSNLPGAKATIRLVREAGLEVTEDWTDNFGEVDTDSAIEADIRGVFNARHLLITGTTTSGVMVELGAALTSITIFGLDTHIHYICGLTVEKLRHFFLQHSRVHIHRTLDDAINAIKQLEEEREKV